MASSLETVIKGQKSKGRVFLPSWSAGDVGAAEAAAELSRTQKKQHVGSIMGPPIRSKGCYFYFWFFSLFWLFYNPAFSGREDLLGKSMKILGKTGMAGQQFVRVVWDRTGLAVVLMCHIYILG